MSQVERFTITLPRYGYRQDYNTSAFISRFSNSVITAALQSRESVIQLVNPDVTPQVLQLLGVLLNTGRYPYVPSSFIKPLDYLGIDLPPIVYNPKYLEVLNKYPGFDLNHLEPNYLNVLEIARNMQFPGLAAYLFRTTNPIPHTETDYKFFTALIELKDQLSTTDSDIAVMLLKDRNVRELLRNGGYPGAGYLSERIITYRMISILQAYLQVAPPESYAEVLISDILENILQQTAYTNEFLTMIQIAKEYVTEDETYELTLIQLVRDIVSGDINEIKGHIPDDIPLDIGVDIPALLYLALVKGHYDIAYLLFEELSSSVLRQYHRQEAQEILENWYDYLLRGYFKGPTTPNGIRFLDQMTYLLEDSRQAQQNLRDKVLKL